LLKKVAVVLLARVRLTSRLGEACGYLLAQWKPLTAHLHYGQTRLDTNVVENAIRPTKLGAKNWLFIGHPDAGQRSAIIYSIVGSCRRHGIDPLLYLRDILTRLPTMTNQDALSGLRPSQWRRSPWHRII
jgi:transposase